MHASGPSRYLSHLFSLLHPVALVWPIGFTIISHYQITTELPSSFSVSRLDSIPSGVYTETIRTLLTSLLFKADDHLDALTPHCPRGRSPGFLALHTASLLGALLLMLLVLTQTLHTP